MLETKKSFIYVFFNSYFKEYKRRRVYTDRGGGYHSTWEWEGDYLEVSYTSRSKKIKIDSGVS